MYREQMPQDTDPPAFRRLLAEGLRLARDETGMSQEDLAQAMRDSGYPHFHQQTVARIESAARPVRADELAQAAAILGVSVDSLMRPQPAAGRAWEITAAVREVKAAERNTAAWQEALSVARRRLEHALARAEKTGVADHISDEMDLGRRTLEETT